MGAVGAGAPHGRSAGNRKEVKAMAWNKAMRAWANAGPERKPRGTILEIEETLADGKIRCEKVELLEVVSDG